LASSQFQVGICKKNNTTTRTQQTYNKEREEAKDARYAMEQMQAGISIASSILRSSFSG
jgi:hypothetical protein